MTIDFGGWFSGLDPTVAVALVTSFTTLILQLISRRELQGRYRALEAALRERDARIDTLERELAGCVREKTELMRQVIEESRARQRAENRLRIDSGQARRGDGR